MIKPNLELADEIVNTFSLSESDLPDSTDDAMELIFTLLILVEEFRERQFGEALWWVARHPDFNCDFMQELLSLGATYAKPGHGLKSVDKINGRGIKGLIESMSSRQRLVLCNWQRWVIEAWSADYGVEDERIEEMARVLAWLEEGTKQ